LPITFSALNNQFRWRPAFAGAAIRTKVFPEAASADFRYGEAVILSSSSGVNSVTQLATAPAAGAVSSSVADGQLLLGWALKDATGTTGTPCPVLLAKDVEVLVRLYNATASSAEAADVAMGDHTELFRYKGTDVATNIFTVCTAAPNGTAGINMCKIVGVYSQDLSSTNANLVGEQATGDDYGLVWIAARDSQVVN
jgi:hypothetical protein